MKCKQPILKYIDYFANLRSTSDGWHHAFPGGGGALMEHIPGLLPLETKPEYTSKCH